MTCVLESAERWQYPERDIGACPFAEVLDRGLIISPCGCPRVVMYAKALSLAVYTDVGPPAFTMLISLAHAFVPARVVTAQPLVVQVLGHGAWPQVVPLVVEPVAVAVVDQRPAGLEELV